VGQTGRGGAWCAVLLTTLIACAPGTHSLRPVTPSPTAPSPIVHHFNRNAFVASVRAGTGQLVALSLLYDTIGCGGRTFTAYADGVYELEAESGRFSRLSTPGVRSPMRLGCDREGRLVLLGHGLSRLEGGKATPLPGVDASLAAWKVSALAPDTGDGLAAAIDGRGVALLPAEMVRPSLSEARDEGDRPTAEPEPQAAFVALGEPEPKGFMEELDDALMAAHAGGFTGRVRKAEVGTRLVFTGPDAKRIGDILRPILVRSQLAKATLYLRDGPPDTLERRIEIQPEAR
jgi:hypothetical protein